MTCAAFLRPAHTFSAQKSFFFQKNLDNGKRACYNILRFAAMAQSVEHIIGNDEVTSSILVSSSKSTCFCKCFFCVCETALTFDKKEEENGSRPYKMAETARTPQNTFLLPPQKSSLSGAFFLLFTLFLISALFCVSRLDFLFDGIYQPHGEKRAQRADNRATEHIRGIMHADIQPRQRNQHGKHNCGNRNFLRRA